MTQHDHRIMPMSVQVGIGAKDNSAFRVQAGEYLKAVRTASETSSMMGRLATSLFRMPPSPVFRVRVTDLSLQQVGNPGQLIYRYSVPETYLSFNSPIYEQTKSNSTKHSNN